MCVYVDCKSFSRGNFHTKKENETKRKSRAIAQREREDGVSFLVAEEKIKGCTMSGLFVEAIKE